MAVTQNGGPGTAANVRIRGGTANQTLVLIDGAIVNSATLGDLTLVTSPRTISRKLKLFEARRVRSGELTRWVAW